LRVVSFLFGTGVIVFLHVVIGEQAPKWMAIQAPEPTTLWIAYPLRGFHILMYPFIAALNAAANGFVRMIGIRTANEGDLAHSEEEFRLLLASSSRVGIIPPDKRALIENVFDLSETIVRQIMVPRTEVAAFDVRKPLAESLRIALRTAHSRYPLIDGDMDHVLGVIHMKDLFWQLNEMGQPTVTPAAQVNPMIAGGDVASHPPASGAEFLRKIARPALLVPETMRVDALLRQLQQKRVHLAMVVDEFGGVSGMVTFENVIEEIVGDVQDEFDQEMPQVWRVAEGEFVMDGAANLFDVNQALGTHLAAENVDTIAGFLLQEFGRLPDPGDHVTVGGYEITVREVRKRRIHRVHARAIRSEPAAETPESDDPPSH
jgi:CBS domain containing-hemolysin-like protein